LCLSEPHVLEKKKRKESRTPNYMEEKEPPFPQSLAFGSGHMTERAMWLNEVIQ